MRKTIKKVSCLILAIMILLNTSSVIYAAEIDIDRLDTDVDFLKNVILFLNHNYQYELNQDDIMNALYDGLFEILDDYSVFYTKEEYESFAENLSGEFSGIGVQITQEKDRLVVSVPLPGTPALKAGIQANDELISVDGESVKGFTTTQVSKLIRGIPGTVVKIGILRDGKELFFNIVREIIEISSVEYDILNNNIGYLKITEFNENTTNQVVEALSDFDSKNITKLVIDVRDNPGGSLSTVVDILNFFVPEGPLLRVEYKALGEITYESALEEQKYDVCVLVNENSASAAEIFAGAIQDRGVGKIVGTATYGKGVVQSLYHLKNETAVKFTTAEYFTPNNNKVQGVGIKPDIAIENTIGKSKVDLSSYPELKKERKPTLNTVGLDVLSAEMILETLGYKINTPDGILDKVTFEQIKKFQKDNHLFPYGVLDYSTQDALTNALNVYAIPDTKDTQLDKAVEVILKR